MFCSLSSTDLICIPLYSATEGTYTFSDGTSFTLTGGTIGTSDATWSSGFTAWKDGQPKDDPEKQEKQDCVKVSIQTKFIKECNDIETQHNAFLDMVITT